MTRFKLWLGGALSLTLSVGFIPALSTPAQAAVGQGFTVSPADLKYILKQIKIAEQHAATATTANPCGTLVGTGPNQIPSPLISFGLRTVDGSCNNLVGGQERFGSADQPFPRIAPAQFNTAEGAPAGFFGPGSPAIPSTSYAQKNPGNTVVDSQPRLISNLIVDQTSRNPSAVAAAGAPVRTQGNEGVLVCTAPDVPVGCTPPGETLFIENVTTDVGLSPPFNGLFTIFGQFFDHGVDQTTKGGGTVIVPLKADDPLIIGKDGIAGTADDPVAGDPDFVPPNQRFMALTRGTNLPGPDGVMGTADDVQDARNTDSPWVDQSQTYTSHPSHQVLVRQYVNNTAARPVSTGELLHSADGGQSTWAMVKAQAATLLGLRLTDRDVTDVPMLLTDPYGKFVPGPARGLPQYVTATGLVEGNRTGGGVPVPANVRHFDTPFLTDIAHNADPSPQDTDHNPGTPPVAPTPDANTTASADFASQPPGTYDDEMLNAHFICGDGRCNENIALTAVHQMFHSEHDRLVGDIKNTIDTDAEFSAAERAEWKLALGAAGWNGERLFQAARFVTEMEYQHLVFEEFARKVQPLINPFQPFAFTQTEKNAAVRAEFAHAVYRFGHSMLTEDIARTNANGSKNDISLLKGFLNPPEYFNGGPAGTLTSRQAATSIIMGMSDQAGNEIDEFVTDTLRNNLLGLPLDLPTINMTRARSEGVPSLNNFRKSIFAETNDGALQPYKSWVDFGQNIKHPASLINFVAAYGKHPSITSQTTVAGKRAAAKSLIDPAVGEPIVADASAFLNSSGAWATQPTGLDDIDLWVGGLAEQTMVFGGLLGTTFNYVFEQQLTDLQNGDRLYYLARTPGMNLRAQLEGNSFAEMVMRNTDTHTLKADPFATADCKFELSNLAGTAAGFAAQGNNVANDVASECDETALLIRMPDGTIQYRARNSVDPSGINGQSVYNGTAGVDRIYGGNDSDTFWGNEGNDRIEGGDGADVALGGDGDDIITDLGGDDVPKGGPGNDAIDGGPGLDIIMGGDGKDFSNGGANINETFAGAGDDFIIAGQGEDAVFGDSGNDWMEGGDQPDLLQGDSGNLFFLDDSQKPGHDIQIGQGGDDDYDMEGGDDVGVSGPGLEKVAGASGYDWEIAGAPGQGDPQAQDLDLALPLVPLDILTVDVRDKFNEVEALSGGALNDKIRGDDVVPSAVGGAGFIGCDALDAAGIARISGLSTIMPALIAKPAAFTPGNPCTLTGPIWGEGNILLGGAGDDLIEGRGGDDVIDGDRWLNVRLSVRTDPNNPATETRSAKSMAELQKDVFAGLINPGNIVAVREILTSPTANVDTAVFSGPQDEYTITPNANGSVTVQHDGGAGADGTDILRNIEVLQFGTAVLQVPDAPLIGAVTRGTNSATVRWAAPVDDGGSPITSYDVRTYVGTATTQAPGVAVVTVNGAARQATVTGLVNGTSYTFDVVARNLIGVSPASARSATVVAASPPSAPGIRTAVSGNPGGPVNVIANWVAPASTGGSPITGYRVNALRIALNGGVGGVTQSAILGPNARSLLFNGLVNGGRYRFTVVAINAIGTSAQSAQSNLVIAR